MLLKDKLFKDNAVFPVSLALLLLILLLALPYHWLGYGWAHPVLLLKASFWITCNDPAPLPLQALGYIRPLIARGELWRLLTAHFVHLNLGHALLDGSGLALFGFYFRYDFPLASWLGLILVSAMLISVGLYLGQPWLDGYAGFSGVLHALLYAGLIVSWRELPRLNSLVLAVLVGRLFWEHSPAYNPFYLKGVMHGMVVPAAHLYGAMVGTAWGLATLGLRRWRGRQEVVAS